MSNANITIIQYNYEDQLIQEEMLQDIINNGVYETNLTPGKYKIIVQKFGFTEVDMDYVFKFGNQELKLPLAQKLQVSEEEKLKNTYKNNSINQESVQKNRVRPTSGRPQSSNSQQGGQKNTNEQKNMPVRPSSANKILNIQVYEAGNFQQVIQNCSIKVFFYFNILKQIKFNQRLLIKEDKQQKKSLMNTDSAVQFQMDFSKEFQKQNMKVKNMQYIFINQKKDYMKIVEEYGHNKMDLNKMTELSFPLIRKPETDNEVNILVLTDTDKQILNMNVINPKNEIIQNTKGEVLIEPNAEQCSILIKINKIKQQNGIYRIFANVNDIDYLSPSSVKLYIITQKNMHFVEVPKTHPLGLSKNIYWDIGVVCAPTGDFIEINACTSQEIKKDMYLYQYKKLIDFLYNSKQIDTKSILGFNKSDKDNDVLQIQGDTFVKKEKIEQSLEKYIDKNAKGIEHLINSALNTNGLYSYNKLKAKLDSIKYPVNFGNLDQLHEEEDEEDEML
ncbi:hypothetical protein IMG5_099500 [Ichthyophthirius multifiliis]|uniref:Uncharacterized protein n=1 Tax=Ichthyophthirius multifiliis TaxID=5932 RepID=G0QS57_ICHMU|nr:hypothetical protein IMG5_099500 [Ichthyophthirius multifiliis]EGR31922.1 hypothetical protein IMG5_099500 [Ichthyophthirius multifiliis]|eukprot:XP_004035408.1 hypothetical protein IMG5_099500 [Ichthyophthirius multifiliis]